MFFLVENNRRQFCQMFGENLWKKQQYESVNNEEPGSDSEELNVGHGKAPGNTRQYRCLSVSVMLGLVLVTTVWLVFQFTFNKASHWDQCGTTPEEARLRGCIFEVTLSLWVPEQCYDRELEEEYLRSEGLVYYRDLNFTQEVPFDEVKLGEQYGWFVPWQHHIRHCAFGLRKFHRAVVSSGKIDGYLINYNHTMHCLDMLTDPPEDLTRLPQRDIRRYPYCGRRGGFNVDKTKPHQWTN